MLKQLPLATFLTVAAAALLPAEELLYPVDVALDADGTVFVADHEAHALLKLGDAGFRVVARGEGLPRTPLYGIRHIAADGRGGFVASDPATMKLYRIDTAGEVAPVPDDERFVTPWGVAVEPSGAILAVDRVTHRLRRVLEGGEVEDVAEIRAPRAVLFDRRGAIIVLTDDALLRVEDGATTPITRGASFEFPHDAVLHPDGSFYVTDGYARAIWRVDPEGEVSAFVQGDPLVSPQGIAVDAKGVLYVADAHARSIFRVTPEGELTTLAK